MIATLNISRGYSNFYRLAEECFYSYVDVVMKYSQFICSINNKSSIHA